MKPIRPRSWWTSRGRETTQYVADIYKYYLAYRMADEIRERKAAAKNK